MARLRAGSATRSAAIGAPLGALAAAGRLRRAAGAGSRASSPWDAYLLRSASVYEEACGHHTITQGGYYQYGSGAEPRLAQLAALPAADGLRRSPSWRGRSCATRSRVQSRDGTRRQLPYGTGSLCTPLRRSARSSDLDFWLLLAAGEYGLGARDPRFFDERLPFYDTGGSASAWRHLKIAFRHQESLRGPHGGYLAGDAGDWSDFSSVYLHMTESLLVPAQLAYAYPRLAELAELRGDRRFAATAAQPRRRAARVRRARVDRPGLVRARLLGRPADRQPVPSSGSRSRGRCWPACRRPPGRKTLVANIRRFLTGIGAPRRTASRIGSAISPAAADPDVTEPRTATGPLGDAGPLIGASQFPGGVWFDVNGWLTWALSELDGVVPHARRYAWDEYTRNTLAAHTRAFPDHWNGTISSRRRLQRLLLPGARALRDRRAHRTSGPARSPSSRPGW